MEHLKREEIEAFVMGLAVGDAEAFRRHVADCPDCAARLAREARVEVLMHDVAPQSVRPPSASSQRFYRTDVLRFSLGIAAALVLVVGVWLAVKGIGMRSGDAVAPVQRERPVPATDVVDPLVGMPGYEVVSPRDYCRDVEVPLGREMG